MRVLIHPVNLEIGGSALNAIDLAAEVRDRGHEVAVFARPGPLQDYLREKSLSHIVARPRMVPHPTPGSIAELSRVVRRHRVHLVHAYEPYSCVEALLAATALHQVAVAGTLYSMSVDPWLPTSMPVIAGFRAIQPQLRAHGVVRDVPLLEPPIDTRQDVADPAAGGRFRREWGIGEHEPLVVLVSRLSVVLKLDSLMDSISGVDRLAQKRHVRLVVVGDGDARMAVQRAAGKVNASHGREVVTMTGALMDPRPAYAAADVVLGMGTSALRAMSMEKVVVVVGERGFSRLVSPANGAYFHAQGFYGVWNGRDPDRLAGLLGEAIDMAPAERKALGRYGRDTVCGRFSLESAGRWLESFYRRLLEDHAQNRKGHLGDALQSSGRLVRHLTALHAPHNTRRDRLLAHHG